MKLMASSSKLPAAIWFPSAGDVPAIYRGSPVEMVREMAEEMDEPVLEDAVEKLLAGLAENRHVNIRLPSGLAEEARCGLFVKALLVSGLGREMPQA
jgi:hypothetical protein